MNKYLKEMPEKTCIVLKDEEIIFTSEAKGVKPLIDFYNAHGTSYGKIKVCDRIIGKGAILLAIKCQAEEVYTPIISQAAIELADKYGLSVEYDKQVVYIVNRAGDGQCPIEACLKGIDDIDEGYDAILKRLEELRNA